MPLLGEKEMKQSNDKGQIVKLTQPFPPVTMLEINLYMIHEKLGSD